MSTESNDGADPRETIRRLEQENATLRGDRNEFREGMIAALRLSAEASHGLHVALGAREGEQAISAAARVMADLATYRRWHGEATTKLHNRLLELDAAKAEAQSEKLSFHDFRDGMRQELADRNAEIARLKQEASASDAHAGATMDVKTCAMEVVTALCSINTPTRRESVEAILRKHFRAAPAVYLTDLDAAKKDIVDTFKVGSYLSGLDETLHRHTKRIDREALAKVILDSLRATAQLPGERSTHAADAVLSFIGAGAEEKPLTSQELRDRARASLAAAAREKMSAKLRTHDITDTHQGAPPAPVPQESDVESLARAIVAEREKFWETPKDARTEAVCYAEGALKWFRAHRVVELPKTVFSGGVGTRQYCGGWNHCLASVKSALDRAGIAHRSAT